MNGNSLDINKFCIVLQRAEVRSESISRVGQIEMMDLHMSSRFLIRMFTVFLDLTEPASRKAKPACMTERRKGGFFEVAFMVERASRASSSYRR